jgi:hypothetical protein
MNLIQRIVHVFKRDNSQSMVLRLRSDGSRCAVWNDNFPIEELGTPRISRASNVEFNPITREWEVVMAGETEPRFSHKLRSECIKWEVAFIHANFTEVLQYHFPVRQV